MCKTGDDENLYDKLGIFVHLGINHVILLYIIGVVCNKLSEIDEIDENTLLEYRVYQLKIQAMYIDYIYFQNNSKTKSSYNFYLKENWDLINELIKDLQPISCLDNDINSVYMLLMQLYDIFTNCKDKPLEQLDMQLEKICVEAMNNIFINEKYELFHEYLRYIEKLGRPEFFTHHEVCDKMFENVFQGKSKVFIQMPDLREREFSEYDKYTDNQKSILLQCSLLTLPMLHYDRMMLSAIPNNRDDYGYRPYFFSFIAEINRNEFQRLQDIQNQISSNNKVKDEDSYFWTECTFVPDERFDSNSGYSRNNSLNNLSYYDTGDSLHFRLNGYVIQSIIQDSTLDKQVNQNARPVKTIKKPLYILSGTGISLDDIKLIVDTYEIPKACEKDDKFNWLIKDKIGNRMVSYVDVYRIGNGNCVFVKIEDNDEGFFYDIGFNCKQRLREIEDGRTDNYFQIIQEIVKNKPSFFILSHWDLDHILGISAANENYFTVDWFAPDCYDACIEAKRLAKYLDVKNHLFRVKRKDSLKNGRLIGAPIKIKNSKNQIIGQYKLYMGEKSGCDSSYSNCEGIVIEYTDFKSGEEKVFLMMGDVNYASFDKARVNAGEPKIADSQIDYLIVPHHGSQHTAYKSLIKNKAIHKGKLAVICCTNDYKINRPNKDHLKKLKKRFKVVTTEKAKKSIRIPR
jgi:hypothetical protein